MFSLARFLETFTFYSRMYSLRSFPLPVLLGMLLKCILHEISYFLKRKNSLNCSVTCFSVSCFYGLFPRYLNLFDKLVVILMNI